jgi:antitoxin component YwqK of YwqJK toxin-antitoxin module
LFFYYPDGSLKGKVKLRNSYAEGTMCYYYFNGCLANKIQYKKGLIDGNFTTYYSTGAVRIKGRYKANGRKGKWEEYYENGILMKSGYYCRDIKPIVVTAENYFDIIKSFPYLLDSHIYIGSTIDFKSGLWKYYSEDGTLQSEELYKNGLLIWDIKY